MEVIPENNKQVSEKQPSIFSIVISWLKKKYSYIASKPWLATLVIAFLLNIIIEMLSRHSVAEGFMFMFRNPTGFLLCISIISITFIPTLLIKKRIPLTVLISAIWLGFGITDYIITSFRLDPFTLNDFSLLKAAIPILPNYLGIWGIIGISAGFIVLIALIIMLFIKLPSEKSGFLKGLKSSVGLLAIFGIILFTAAESGATALKLPMVQAYKSSGFAYCFTAGIFSRGVSRPSGYSKEAVDDLQNQLTDDEQNTKATDVTDPNIILIQLESFFDIKYVNGVEFSEDPLPTFTKLKETCAHGALRVPVIGGGTANTEFEVLTGMNKEHFGMGEYPYKTILQESTCESICYNLKSSGYTSHAIHNHYGTFYDRYKVFRNLGFDTFTPVEHMTYVPTTFMGWEKDEILPTYISECMNSTDGRDFIFTITVQGHGTYPTAAEDGYTPRITATTDKFSESERISMEYYADMLYETDAMIARLIEMYNDCDEPVMIVMYGDHLPNFEITDEDMSETSVIETEYVIWTNYDLGTSEQKNLTSYQLAAYIMELCGKNDGIITKVHQTYSNSDDYEEMLQMLEYSMLYDKNPDMKYIHEKYAQTDMKLGILDIRINGAGIQYDDEAGQSMTVVKGTNFTTWSVVYINGSPARTIFRSPTTLLLENANLKEGDTVQVAQIAQDKTKLSVTDEYIVKAEDIHAK